MWYVKSSIANVCRFVYACIETVAGVTASTERVEDRLVDEDLLLEAGVTGSDLQTDRPFEGLADVD